MIATGCFLVFLMILLNLQNLENTSPFGENSIDTLFEYMEEEDKSHH